MPPCRVAIQTRSPIGQTRGQIQVLMSELEPSLGFVGIKDGDLTVLLSGAAEVLLGQVYRAIACWASRLEGSSSSACSRNGTAFCGESNLR